jgi:ribosomal protein L14E/L6E/L27E
VDLVTGSVVRALSGRDKGGFFAVISAGEREVMLCDGKRRTLERPKRKNIIHVAPTQTVLDERQMTTNAAVRKALSTFIHREEFACQNRTSLK